jgi:hypothetical protein
METPRVKMAADCWGVNSVRDDMTTHKSAVCSERKVGGLRNLRSTAVSTDQERKIKNQWQKNRFNTKIRLMPTSRNDDYTVPQDKAEK